MPRSMEFHSLGPVILAEKLKWNKHVDMITNKVSKVVGILRKVGHLLHADKLKLLYHTLLEPHINYCCVVWASPYRTCNLDRTLKLQKTACRIISHSPYLAH